MERPACYQICPQSWFLSLNISLPAIVINHEIEDLKPMLPYAIFVLYGDENEFTRLRNEERYAWDNWFKNYYILKKEKNEQFEIKLRQVLDEAIDTSFRKIELKPRFQSWKYSLVIATKTKNLHHGYIKVWAVMA